MRLLLVHALLLTLLSSCAATQHTHPKDPTAEALQAEVEKERQLLRETRAELQTLVGQLQPLLHMVALLKLDPAQLPAASTHGAGSETEPTGAADTAAEALASRLAAGVKKLSETRYRMSKSLLDELAGNPAVLSRGARLVPSVKNGQPNGFKLYAIRPTSILATLGFMNGDTLTRINGHDLSSPEKALEVYSELRKATMIKIEIVRRGKPRVHHIEIK